MTIVGIPKEITVDETRVAAHPETITKLIKNDHEVIAESGAGLKSFISDEVFAQAGARIVKDSVYPEAEVVFKIQPPQPQEVESMREKAIYIGPIYPHTHKETLERMVEKKINAFALEMLPRIARAQAMDILSSMSNLSGYKAVLLASNHLPKIFPMLTTAAGTIQPAKTMVIGAGVAGLQAIATARRLGAVVIGFDTRPVTEEQVKSLGADFVSMEVRHEDLEDTHGYAKEQSTEFYAQEQTILHQYTKQTDVIITTALIPRKRAPLLITDEMVAEMKPGSVIVDLAAAEGGNCALTEAQKIVVKHGVTIIGYTNLPALTPSVASLLFSRNLFSFFQYIAAQLVHLDLNDEIIKNCLLIQDGQVVHSIVQGLVGGTKYAN